MAGISIRNRNKGKFDKDGNRKSPNWEYRFDIAKVDGKRKQICKSGYPTKSAAEKAGNQALAQYNNCGLFFEPSSISISDYLDYWLKTYCLLNISDNTLTAYKNIIEKHLKPRIGAYKLNIITTLQLQEMINDIYVQRGFSKSFMQNILKVLKGSFKYACSTAKLIQVNPTIDVTLPNIIKSHNNEKGEIIILSKSEISTILERFKQSPSIYYAILTAYYTGLRISEVYGLTWDCVDFENRQITVNKIAKKIEREGKVSNSPKRGVRGKATTKWYFGECKTKSSYRTIDIGDYLLNALKEYKLWQKQNALLYDDLYTNIYLKDEVTQTHRKVQRLIPICETGFEISLQKTYPVFIKENGEFHGTDTIKYASKVINYNLGINFNFHALRHTHATMLIEAGIPVKAVSERLGHSSVRTTLETYVHVTDSMKNDAVNKFESIGNLNETKIIPIEQIKRKNA
ncbi:MAG: site-specific integrase [Eubacterium sp.]|nr:site-specific integrase [Eubacterium sp.]